MQFYIFLSRLTVPQTVSNMHTHVAAKQHTNHILHSSAMWCEETTQLFIFPQFKLHLFLNHVLAEAIHWQRSKTRY